MIWHFEKLKMHYEKNEINKKTNISISLILKNQWSSKGCICWSKWFPCNSSVKLLGHIINKVNPLWSGWTN